MRMVWLAPVAWVGLLAVAVPIVVHLLTRQRARRLPFPTLRFLHATRLSAFRRRSIDDLWLLVLRLSIITAAVAALAAPVFVSASRQAAWRARVASAFVVVPSARVDRAAQEQLLASERAASTLSAVFMPSTHVADGLRDAAMWLRQQPPASREVVIVGDLRQGALAAADLTLVAAEVGIRFLPLPVAERESQTTLEFQQDTTRWRAAVSLRDETTHVAYEAAAPGAVPIIVRAAPADQSLAIAALDAVVARGVTLPRTPRRLVVVFAGGDSSDLAPGAETIVVRLNQRPTDLESVHALERVVREAFAEDRSIFEPVAISASTLAAWARAPQPGQVDRPPDDGDRRWLWSAALILMVLEHFVRRRGDRVSAHTTVEEQRVA